MTTYAYVGRPGSGKSYSVVENQIMPAFKAGRRVVTNIPLNMDAIRKVEKCEHADLVEFPVQAVKENPARITEFVKPGDVFVLDEVSKIWPAGEKMKDVPAEYVSFLTEHRHMVDVLGNSVVIILVVQDLGNIGLWALRLVDFTYNHTKLSVVGASGSFRVDIYEGPVKGPNYPVKRRTRFLVGRYTKAVYGFYKSHTQSESKLDGANEKSMDKRASILKKWGVMIGVPGGIIGIFVGFHFLGSAMDKAKQPLGAKASSASVAPSADKPNPFSLLGNRAAEAIERPPAYRIIATALNDAHPEKSLVALRMQGDPHVVNVSYSKCRMADEQLECPVHHWWYTVDGLAETAGQLAGAPLGTWSISKGVAIGSQPPPASKLGLPAVLSLVPPAINHVDAQKLQDKPSGGLVDESAYTAAVLTENPVTGAVVFQSPSPNVIFHGQGSESPSARPSEYGQSASRPR